MTGNQQDKTLSILETLHTLVGKMGGLEEKIDEIGEIVKAHTKKLDSHEDMILSLTRKVNKLSVDMDYVKEKQESIPKIYNSIDTMLGRILAEDRERAFLSGKVGRHETRLAIVESVLAIIPNTDSY